MKYIKYFILLGIVFLVGITNVNASYRMKELDVSITLDEYGTAHIVEKWNVYVGEGTELYKTEYNLGNIKIENFKVEDETGTVYTLVDRWNINGSLNDKKYKNGYYYSSSGLELCWGASSYKNHIYTISYDMKNAVFNTNDAQVLNLLAIDKMKSMPAEKFKVTITGPNPFSDTLDVWGNGYKGYAYVKDGKILMSNEEEDPLAGTDFVNVLVKFPLDTFKVDVGNAYEEYQTFDDVQKDVKEGQFEYDYDIDEEYSIFDTIFGIISTFIFPIIIVIVFAIIFKKNSKYQFGEKGRKINMKEINMFRDIPCDKDIFKAYFIASAYRLNSNQHDLLGAIFLKWLFEDRIKIEKENVKKLIGSKEETTIVFINPNFDTPIEKKLYVMLKEAGIDEKLTSKELENWCKTNYDEFLKYFDRAEYYGRDLYVASNQVSVVTGSFYKYKINDTLKDEAIKLAGLKKYLIEFSRIKEKEAMEVKLWKEYLMYAQIFGIADKVAKQLKEFYPEIRMENSNIDMTDIIMINHICNVSAASASSARMAAESYSSGGGGFSSGGGGGGFGGGGGAGGR